MNLNFTVEDIRKLKEIKKLAPFTWTCSFNYYTIVKPYCSLDEDPMEYKVIDLVLERMK